MSKLMTRTLAMAILLVCAAAVAFASGQQAGSEEVPTLTWYYFGFDAGPDQDLVEEAMSDYIEPLIGARIDMIPLDWDPFINQTNVKLAADEPYDIVFAPVWIDFLTGVSRNKYMDITEMLPEHAPELYAELGEARLAGAFNGVQYAVPTLKEIAESDAFYINQELLDAHGLSADGIETAADIVPLLRTIADNEPDVIPFDVSGLGLVNLAEGVDYLLGDDTIPIALAPGSNRVVLAPELGELQELYQLTRSLIEEGILSADAVVQDQARMDTLKEEGLVFSFVGGGVPGQEAGLSNENVTWIQVNITTPRVTNKSMRGSMNAISSTSRHPEEALAFLNLINTDPYLNNLWAYGIEGQHWEWVDEDAQIIRRIPDSGFNHDWQWAFANQFLNYLRVEENPNKWDRIAAYNDAAVRSPALGFDVDLSDFETEIQSLKLIMDEQLSLVRYGGDDFEEAMAEMIEDLYNAGAQDVIDYVQEQYDAFQASR